MLETIYTWPARYIALVSPHLSQRKTYKNRSYDNSGQKLIIQVNFRLKNIIQPGHI